MQQRDAKKRETDKAVASFPIMNLHAAGIDVGSKEIVLALPPDEQGGQLVKTFKTFTRDLKEAIALLKVHNITTVAMESTGIYWVQFFIMLQDAGFEVYLVNSQHAKNVSGRKKDDSDAQWIQKLHSCGLLTNSFQPDEQTRVLRALTRHRKMLVQGAAGHINRMQKALELMNIKVGKVINDIAGKSGIAIVKAILQGERDAKLLSGLVDGRVKAKPEEIIKSLEGFWQEEHLFTLEQNYALYHDYQEKLHECDKKIEEQLKKMTASVKQTDVKTVDEAKKNCKVKRKRSTNKNQLQFNATFYLKELNGIDVTQIFGISELSALCIFAESGSDMNKWSSRKHFSAWLGLAPNNKISGGKLISSKVPKKKHHAGEAFRIAANSLYKSQNPLGDFYRIIKSKHGPAKATVATARKIACIYYTMIKNKTDFDLGYLKAQQEARKKEKIRQLEKRLALLKKAA